MSGNVAEEVAALAHESAQVVEHVQALAEAIEALR